MKKQFWLILLAVVLLIGVLTVQAATIEETTAVVYVNDKFTGTSTGDDQAPFTTLKDAITGINAMVSANSALTQGVIVLVEDMTITSYDSADFHTLPACSVPLFVTGADVADPAVITFGGNIKKYLAISSETVFDNVIFKAANTNANVEIWSGPSLTMGENVTFVDADNSLPNADKFTIRGGATSNVDSVYIEVNNGQLSMIHGGNNKANVGEVTIVLNDGVNVCNFVQMGGTNKNATSAELIMNGATVKTIYTGGYGGGQVTNSTMTATNSTITTLTGQRSKSGSGGVTGAINVTLDHTKLTTMENLAATGATTRALKLQNYSMLSTNFSFVGWTAVELKNATVASTVNYAGPSVTADADSLLILDQADGVNATLPTVTDSRVLGSKQAIVYLDPAGAYSEEGFTTVTTMEAAYNALNSKGGVVVLCGDLTLTYTSQPSKWYTAGGPVTITSQSSDHVLNFHNATQGTSNNNIAVWLQMETNTKFININLDATNSKGNNYNAAFEFWSAHSLTIDENVKMTIDGGKALNTTYSNGRWCVRMGKHDSSSNVNPSLYMYSGTLSYLQGGNNQQAIGTNYIYLGKNVTIVDYIQCGATKKAITTTNITVDGAKVPKLYLNGYGIATMGTLNLVIQNTSVNTIEYHRTSDATGTTVTVNVTLDNASVGSLCDKDSRITNANLTVKNASLATVGATLKNWTSLTLDNAKLYLTKALNTTATVTSQGSSMLVFDSATYIDGLPAVDGVTVVYKDAYTPAPDPENTLDVVYLDGTNGSDINTGTSAADAVKTFDRAYYIMRDGGTIVLSDDITLTVTNVMYFPDKVATITGSYGGQAYAPVITVESTVDAKPHLQFVKATTIADLTINRGATVAGGDANNWIRCVELWTGPSLTIGSGVNFTNNGKALTHHGDGQIAVRLGHKTSVLASASYTQSSGTVSFIQGGNNAKDVGASTIILEGTATVLDKLQCGGTNKNLESSNVTIRGSANINILTINGYGSASLNGDSNIHVKDNAVIGSVLATRTDVTVTGKITGNVLFQISDRAKVGDFDLTGIEIEGTKTLKLSDVTDFEVTVGFHGWDTVSITGNSTVLHTGKYSAPGTLNIEANATLSVNSCANDVSTIVKTGEGTLNSRHIVTYQPATEPTVAFDGYAEHYVCNSCNKIYSDAAATNEVTRASIATKYDCHSDTGSLTGTGNDFYVEKMFNTSGSQGIAVHGDYMLVADSHGGCSIWNVRTGKKLASFRLGSYSNRADNILPDWAHDGATAAQYENHSNQMMFSSYYYDESDPFPLLYVTAGNDGGYDKYGRYIGHCAVERILYDEETGTWSAECVQRIFYQDASYATTEFTQDNPRFTYLDNAATGFVNTNGYQKIGWGWPASFIDYSPTETTAGKFYLYSARFRTVTSMEDSLKSTYGSWFNYYDHSAYIITEFDLPAPPSATNANGAWESVVVLTPNDITDQFDTEYRSYVTQGGTMYQGKIYYSYGWNAAYGTPHSNSLQVFDIAQKKIVARLDLGEDRSGIGPCEPECTAVYNGKIVMMCNGGGGVPSALWIFGHIAINEGTEATCTDPAYKWTVCDYCGEELSQHTADGVANGHDMTHHAADPSNCTEDGTVEYWSCGTCNKNFADEAGTTELDSIVDTADGHDMTHHDAVPSNCTEDGNIEHWSCGTCDKYFADEAGTTVLDSILDPKDGHDLTKVDEEPATADKAGKEEHWVCETCEKLFSDAEGETEVEEADLVIPALGYEVKTEAATGIVIEGLENAVHGESYTFTVELEEGYVKGENFKVTVNGKELKANADGSYTILSVTEKLEISVTGAVKQNIIPDTGDDFEAWPFVLLMALSAAGIVVMLLMKKRNTK